MKFLTPLLFAFALLFQHAQAQPDRAQLRADLAPFYHGVASGDPTASTVILWTRVTTEEDSVEVEWAISKDSNFTNTIYKGTLYAKAENDHTVKVDVRTLESNTYYYYVFRTGNSYSVVGRTKTAPTADEAEQLRFATVSCSSWQHGYFNVYDRIRERDDIDAVIHLGDYIYEYGPGEYGDVRDHDPPYEMVELADYRTRYSQYRLDPMLRKLHQQYPFITTWDDHESADNSYKDGAENHNPKPDHGNEGPWEDRKAASVKAYSEWMPLRNPDQNNYEKIYRTINYGDLADIFILDTRLIGRDEQPVAADDNPNRELLGKEQLEWLKEELLKSTAQWKVLAQQVIISPWKVAGFPINTDGWDGYTAERSRLLTFIRKQNIDNLVVLTGDVHTTWSMDIPFGQGQYIPNTGQGSMGVEFVTTSVTSPGFPIPLQDIMKSFNPHLRYANTVEHGYNILSLSKEKVQNDIYFVKTILEKNDEESYIVSHYSNDKDNYLTRIVIPVVRNETPPAPTAERPFNGVILSDESEDNLVTVTGVFPNPFKENMGVHYFLQEKANLTLEVFDVSGKSIYVKELGLQEQGLHFEFIDGSEWAKGYYEVVFTSAKNKFTRKVLKQ